MRRPQLVAWPAWCGGGCGPAHSARAWYRPRPRQPASRPVPQAQEAGPGSRARCRYPRLALCAAEPPAPPAPAARPSTTTTHGGLGRPAAGAGGPGCRWPGSPMRSTGGWRPGSRLGPPAARPPQPYGRGWPAVPAGTREPRGPAGRYRAVVQPCSGAGHAMASPAGAGGQVQVAGSLGPGSRASGPGSRGRLACYLYLGAGAVAWPVPAHRHRAGQHPLAAARRAGPRYGRGRRPGHAHTGMACPCAGGRSTAHRPRGRWPAAYALVASHPWWPGRPPRVASH